MRSGTDPGEARNQRDIPLVKAGNANAEGPRLRGSGNDTGIGPILRIAHDGLKFLC